MATKNIVPRATGEGSIGTTAKKWLKGWFESVFLGNLTPGNMVKVSAGNVIEDGTNTDTEVADAVTKKHTQNEDTGSDADPFTLTGKFKRSSQVGITAFAGGGQGDAVEITKDIVEIAVCATEGDSVKLPAAVAGLQITIINHGAEFADVFPATGDIINSREVDASKSIANNEIMLFYAWSSTNWECLTLVGSSAR